MINLKFSSTEEFETLFRKKNTQVTDGIVLGIEKALTNQKKQAELFNISFDDVELAYEITLPQSQWTIALQSCLDFYHEKGDETDKCIDTWKLLEACKIMTE
mgnify:FL=1